VDKIVVPSECDKLGNAPVSIESELFLDDVQSEVIKEIVVNRRFRMSSVNLMNNQVVSQPSGDYKDDKWRC
jgi:hypothetical protein